MLQAQETVKSTEQILSFRIADQIFGIPVQQTSDILSKQRITPIPLVSPAIAGVMNLRGRIVTAIDVRYCLGLPSLDKDANFMYVVVMMNDELFSLMIDKIGDVLSLTSDTYEKTPPTLDPVWRNVSTGIHKLQNEILVILDVKELLNLARNDKNNGK